MYKTLTLAKKELMTFFHSPVAYIVLGVFLLTSGWLYFPSFFLVGESSMRGFFAITPLLTVIFAPATSMRLLAEERKSGSLELLTTMPLTDTQVIVAKYLAGLALLAIGYLFTLSYPVSVALVGNLDFGPVFTGYLGITFLAASLIGLGLLASTWTKNQIIALILALAIGFAFYLIDDFAIFLPEWLGSIMRYLSLSYHFEGFARGVIDVRDVIYYLSLAGLFVYLAIRSLGLRRNA
jgi:ABC-2 type transport system permease protein